MDVGCCCSDSVVRLACEAGSRNTVDGKIVGLDKFGFVPVTIAVLESQN